MMRDRERANIFINNDEYKPKVLCDGLMDSGYNIGDIEGVEGGPDGVLAPHEISKREFREKHNFGGKSSIAQLPPPETKSAH